MSPMLGERVLLLAPRSRESQFACGGTVSRLLEEGAEVHYAVFHTARRVPSPAGADPDTLGIPPENLHVYGYDTCDLPAVRQELLEDLVSLRQRLQPDAVFLPSRNDLHQDDQTVCMEGLRAFKMGTILGYELPWHTMAFDQRHFVVLEARHVQAKIDALGPWGSDPAFGCEEDVWSAARGHGVQVGAVYAEAFDLLRWVRR